jgi:RNA polymerase sigma factor (sigma-70 family)
MERAQWLADVVLPCEPGLRRWLERKHVFGIEVDDIVQETYAILARLSSVSDLRNPRAYVYQTAQSVILMHLRRRRIVCMQAIGDIEDFPAPDENPSPEQAVADRQELRRLSDALGKLPPRCREVFVLRKVDELSQREVAARLGLSERTVETHVAKGLQLLVRLLGREHTPPLNTDPGDSTLIVQ